MTLHPDAFRYFDAVARDTARNSARGRYFYAPRARVRDGAVERPATRCTHVGELRIVALRCRMLGPNRDSALALLDDLLDGVEYARAHDPALWWPTVVSSLAAFEAHPATRDHLRDVPGLTSSTILWGHEQAPAALAEWGQRAYALLRVVRRGRPEDEAVLRAADYQLDTHGAARLRDRKATSTVISVMNGLYIRPLVAWLRAEVLAAVPIEHAIERWIQRAELFGIAAPDLDEAELQNDLHRFLFDAGLEPYRGFDRELQVARGRVDFVLRGDEPVPVELKLWRGAARPGIDAWTYQARTYGTDMRAGRAYLVVANTCADERLERVGVLASGEPLLVRGVQVHVRFLDLGRHAPSKDHDARKARAVTVNDLLLGAEPEAR